MIRPKFDEVTEVTFEEAQEVVDYARSKGLEVLDLAEDKAVRAEVEKCLKENPHALVCHYNHGNEDAWYGNDEKPCVNLENVELLAGRECYAQNCSSAAKLGLEAWKRKATYWGYREVYVFTVDEKDYFRQFNNCGVKWRIDGLDWKTCLKKARELATKLIDELVSKGKALAAACLRHDRDILVLYTEDMPPETDCNFRKVAVKLFGPKVGWKIGKSFPVSVAMFFLGLGILLHDYCHALWQVGGYKEILGLQGGYFGAGIAIVGFILAYYQVWSLLKKGERNLAG